MSGRRPAWRWRYSAWDGTSPPALPDADEILSQLGDDLLYHGDVDAALRRLMQEGFTTRDGRQIEGLRQLMERLAQRRQELAQRGDVSGRYDELAERLEQILDTERQALDAEAAAAARAAAEEAQAAERAGRPADQDGQGGEQGAQGGEQGGQGGEQGAQAGEQGAQAGEQGAQAGDRSARPGDRAASEAARRAADHHAELDLLPPSFSDRLSALQSYDFVSPEARAEFEELLDELRRDLAQMQLDRAAGALAGATPEDREHLRAGLDALNRMLEQRANGEDLDPSFEQFMEQFGDLFPGGAENLDELLEQLAQRMAAASALVASMTPDQRAQLQALSDQLLGDMDLAWQIDRLGANLRAAMPSMGWDARMRMPGNGQPMGFADAADAFAEIGSLDELSQMLGGISSPGELAEVDLERASELLGPDSAESLAALAELTRRLEEAGLVNRREGRLTLTPRGLRRLGSLALTELFSKLRRDRIGDHPLGVSGIGHDPSGETKPYEYGDMFRLDVEKTLRNAIERRAGELVSEEGGPSRRRALRSISMPIRLQEDDFAIQREELQASAATVLAIDLSLSMPMRDNFLAAKKVAMALQALIGSQYPRDYLGLVGFSATAREIRADELPEVSWDFAYGTNLQHALALGRKMLSNRPGAKQIIVITDGEPTAHIERDGGVFFNYPPAHETLEATMLEVVRCTHERVRINTFVLDATGGLRSFIEQMTRRNRGRAFFTTPEDLGDYLLIDFVEHRSARSKRMRPGA